MIFLSTGGRRDQTAATTALEYYRHGIRDVELSGGLYSETCEIDLKALPDDINLRLHNYFPPPAKPFVFNLASCDETTTKLSMKQVRTAMRLAVSLGHQIYSFHAGFRIDPKVSELGKTFSNSKIMDRELALNLFTERVKILSEEALQSSVTLLVENNVLNSVNLDTYGESPLLLAHPDEIVSFMIDAPSNVGLLLDVAHLKVSAQTLGFDMVMAHEKLRPWIKGYHLSDNDGSADSNEPISESSWFWSYLLRDLDYYSLEIYRLPVKELIAQQTMVKRKLFTNELKNKKS